MGAINNSDIDVLDTVELPEGTPPLKEIILRHIRKISDICCQEFVGAYESEKPIKVAGGVVMVKEYHQDVRQAYSESVDFLKDLVAPFGPVDRKDKKSFEEKLNEIEKECKDAEERRQNRRKVFQAIIKMFAEEGFFESDMFRSEGVGVKQ